MAKSNFMTTIAVDSIRSTIHCYSMVGADRSTISHHVKHYVGGQFDAEFFSKFGAAVKEFAAQAPSEKVRKVTVVVPDSVVMTDIVKVPSMRGIGNTQKTLDVTLGGLYRNYNDLRITTHMVEQNRQYSTFSVSAIQKSVVSSIYAACSENQLLVDTLTFASNAAVCGATQLNPKLKNASYLFLDLKDTYCRFVFVANGKPTGSYTLPFGLEFLTKPKVTQEDMLFDHSFAELAVLNAREKAKSKRLTVMSVEEEAAETVEVPEETEPDEPGDDEPEEDEEQEEAEFPEGIPVPVEMSPQPQLNIKVFTRKAPRRLPKFMQRPTPDTPEGVLYENFRVFVKWALTLLGENEKLTELGKPEFVCVNLPDEIAGVLDVVNQEQEENGIAFVKLPTEQEVPAVSANLELFGGLFPKQICSAHKF